MQYRHGDVLLERLIERPGGGWRKLPHRILAHGEVTGHSHRIREAEGCALYEWQTQLLLEVTAEKVTLVHEEHAAIELIAGLYRVWRQREYSPKEVRVVRD